MNYYLELTIMDNPELTPYQIWSKLYTQLHLAFVEQKDEQDKVGYGVHFHSIERSLIKTSHIWGINAVFLHQLSRHCRR
nr:type I-F CRISPR-associated endoribonuclease Cas6/Csy4 [Moraxella canis]